MFVAKMISRRYIECDRDQIVSACSYFIQVLLILGFTSITPLPAVEIFLLRSLYKRSELKNSNVKIFDIFK